MSDKYLLLKKSELKKININDVDLKLPDLKNISEPKSIVIAKWLIGWIKSGVEKGIFANNDILPSKSDFAYKLGVSVGTVQNAIRYVEDLGYLESKQCIGTIISNKNKYSNKVRKLKSKRDLAIEAIKHYIITDGFKVGMRLPSSRTIATIINFSSNTTRLALENLSMQGIIEHKYKNAKDSGYVVKSIDFYSENNKDSKVTTLVDMIVSDLEKYITNNLKIGDIMPSHMLLARELKTSIKTVNDALKILSSRGIILPRRGRYGTIVIKMPNTSFSDVKPETSIFAPAKDTAFYYYEKTQNHIKRMIANDYQVGDKLPSIVEMSDILDLSPNTIRKAFHNLANEGYLVFSRGRYGGTFVIDIPEIEAQTFKWLAVNPQYAKEYQSL